MTTNHQHDGEDELQAARRTAHALGQTTGAEQAEVAAELAASPQARQEVEAVEALAAQLKEAAREAPQPGPSPALREAVERRLNELEPAAGRAAAQNPARPWWRSRMMALALTAACLVALAVPIGQAMKSSLRDRQEVAKQSPADEAVVHESRPATKVPPRASQSYGARQDEHPAPPAVMQMVVEPRAKAEYDDHSKVFEHRGGGAANGQEGFGSVSGGATAFGPGLGSGPYAGPRPASPGPGPKPSTTPHDFHTPFSRAPARTSRPTATDTPRVDTGKDVAGKEAASDSDAVNERARLEALKRELAAQIATLNETRQYYKAARPDGDDRTQNPSPTDVSKDSRAAGNGESDEPPIAYPDSEVWNGLTARRKEVTTSSTQLRATGGGKEHAKSPAEPLETWKPAHVVPNSSRLMVGDKEELPLKGMQVDVRVDGFRARVLIDLYYFNDRPQQLEGNFQLRLPDEASPYFFAFGRTVYQAPQVTAADSMFFKPQQVSQGDTTPEKILALRGNSWEQPKVARMVPKEKAALAYRDTVRRRVDPALVEWSGAGVFQCRVFPLAPQSLHRVTIGYDVDLVPRGRRSGTAARPARPDPRHDRRSEHRRQRRPAGEPRRPRHDPHPRPLSRTAGTQAGEGRNWPPPRPLPTESGSPIA